LEEEQLETHTFKPEISENSKTIIEQLIRKHHSQEDMAKYLPIYNNERLKAIENQKKLKLARLQEELDAKEVRLKEEEDEILKIVAAKTNSNKYNHEEFLKNIESQCKGYINRKEQEKIERDNKDSDIKFAPDINEASKKITKKKNGAKTFRERQVEYEQKNKEKLEKLKKQLKPSFKPTLNPKSKQLHKRMKSNANNQNNKMQQDSPKMKNSHAVSKKLINNDIPEEDEDGSSNDYSLNNQVKYVKNEEIREISEFINASKNSFNENELDSQTIMNMIFAKTDILQKQLDQYRSNNDDVGDLNDREEVKHQHKHSGYSRNRDHDNDELNNRDEQEDADFYDTPDQDDQILGHSLPVHQETPQNGLNQPFKYDSDNSHEEELINPIKSERLRIHDTNDPLETVGEATIEETTKQDITTEEKQGTTYEVQDLLEEHKLLIKDSNKRSSKIIEPYNNKLISEEESGRGQQDKPKQLPSDPMKKLMRMEGKPRLSKQIIQQEELGIGSLDLLNAILKQYNPKVK